MLGGRRSGIVAVVALAGCAGRGHAPISAGDAASLREVGAAALDVRSALARDCTASVKAHPLAPADRAELGAAAGPVGDRLDAVLCWRAVRAFLDWDLSPGTLHRLEAGEPTDDDLEILSEVLADDLPADPI
jgi:hypothetical protein